MRRTFACTLRLVLLGLGLAACTGPAPAAPTNAPPISLDSLTFESEALSQRFHALDACARAEAGPRLYSSNVDPRFQRLRRFMEQDYRDWIDRIDQDQSTSQDFFVIAGRNTDEDPDRPALDCAGRDSRVL